MGQIAPRSTSRFWLTRIFTALVDFTNLESLDEFITVNRTHYHRYWEQPSGLPGLTVMFYDESERCNCQYVVVEVEATKAGISRDALIHLLHEHGVIARRYFHLGCHRMESYATLFPDAGRNLPVTQILSQRLFCLPTGSAVTTEDVKRICNLVSGFLN